MVVVCKYQLKSRPGGTGTGISAEGGEEDYEQMGRDRGGITGTVVLAEEDYDQTGGDKGGVIENLSAGTESGVREVDEEGVGGDDHTYMEIGEHFQLQENEAYGSFHV